MSNDEETNLLRDALHDMLHAFDRTGLYGVMLSAKRSGWTKADVDVMLSASRNARAVLAGTYAAPATIPADTDPV